MIHVLRRLLHPILLAALAAGAVRAHPHVFVDTTLRLVSDAAGRPTGVEVTWHYDDFYSLLIFEDMGIDADYDGELTPEELKKLERFDMNWIEGYEGDLYVTGPNGPVRLGPPEPLETKAGSGRIETRHFRPFAAPAPDTLILRVYDPTYYTAYDLTGAVSAPDGCTVAVEKPDLEAAQKLVTEQLAGRPDTIDDFPEVGEAFAATVTLHCAPSQ